MIRPGLKRVALVTVLGLAATGAGIAYAAGLTVSSGSLGAGTTVVTPCQTTGTIAATYTTANTSGTGFEVMAVALTGIDGAGCAGKTITVVLSDGTATNLGRGSAAVSGSTASLTLAPPVAEAAVTHLDIEIR
jgi:hypothetical protein